MKNSDSKSKHLFIVGLVSFIYFLYASVFLKPWLFKNFSLIDDGQVLIQSSSYLEDCIYRLKCPKFLDQTFEFGTSRFRPSYWVINNFLYEFLGNAPELHHVFRVYVVGYLSVLLLAIILLDMGVGGVFILTGTLVFSTNYAFSENIIRLGTNEPFQVVFLALFSLLYLRKNYLKNKYFIPLVILLTFTILIKENNIAVLPAILSAAYFPKDKDKKIPKKIYALIGIPLIVFILGTVITKILPSSISPEIPIYTENYVINPTTIIENSRANFQLLLNSLSPFLKISIFLLPLFFVSEKTRRELKNKNFYFWSFFTLFFTGILFPWKYVLERYQLVSVFGIITVIFFLFDRFFKIIIMIVSSKISIYRFSEVISNLAIFPILIYLFVRGLPVNFAKTLNYRDSYKTYAQFEADQVKTIANYIERKVYINAKRNNENWEFLYELPIHLKYIYGVGAKALILEKLDSSKTYIFSRTLLGPAVEKEDLEKAGYKILEAKMYHVDQIDPIKFREQFLFQPIDSIIDPPWEVRQDYYWEIRKLE